MAVDRGGLSYQIEIRDLFTKTVRDFREQIKGAKKEWLDFKKASEGRTNSAAGFKETTKAIDENREALKKLDADSKAQAKRERDLNKLRSSLRKDEAAERRRIQTDENKAAAESAKLVTDQQRRLKVFFDTRNRAEKEAARISSQLRKDEAAELQRQQQTLKTSFDARNRAEKEAARIRASIQRDEQNNLKAFVSARNAAEKEAAKISASQKKDLEQQQKQDPAFQAQLRNTKALKEELIVRSQITQLRQKASQQFSQGDLIGGSKTLKQVSELQRSLEDVNRSGNSLFFTFRRLVGILAIFTIARNLVQGFQDLVSEGIHFNDSIKSAEISIAGLISATSDVRDNMGRSVDASKEFALAQIIARDQVKKLQQDAFKTAATLEQLAETFQVAIAPGFRAGLNIDEIRKLTVGISQAASAIGVQQNQLAEEIRSILSGTIQARTTRIATALGISNEDIRRLKETGQLFDFLEKKLSAFSIAQQTIIESTLTGVVGQIKKAVQIILGEAAGPLFESLRTLGLSLFNEVLTIKDALGNITVNPKVVKAVQEIFDALKNGVLQIKDFAKTLGFAGVSAAFKAVGTALSVAIQFALGFAQTFLVTLKSIVAVVQSIADTFGLTTKQLGNVAGAFGVVIASSIIWQNTLGQIGLNFGTIGGFLRAIIPSLDTVLTKMESAGGFAKIIGTALRDTAIEGLAFAAILGIVIKGVQLIDSAILGVDLSLKDVAQITVLALVKGMAEAGGFVSEVFRTIAHDTKEGATSLAESVELLARKAHILLAEARGDTLLVKELEAQQTKIKEDFGLSAQKRDAQFKIDQIARENEALAKQKGIQEEIVKIIGEAAGRNAQGAKFDPNFDLAAFEKARQATRDLKSGLKDFVPIISNADAEIQTLAADLEALNKELLKTGKEFEAAKKNAGLSGTAAQIASIFTQADIDNGEKLKQIQESLKQVNEDIDKGNIGRSLRQQEEIRLSSLKQTEAIKDRLAALNAEEVLDHAKIKSLLRDRADLEKSIGEFTQKNLDNAAAKAAILAVTETPQVRVDNTKAGIELEAEKALLSVQQLRLGARRQATVEAQNAIAAAKVELGINLQQLQANIAFKESVKGFGTKEQQEANAALLAQDKAKLQLEKDIGAAKLAGLETTLQEAALVENGSLTDGIKRGFADLGNELPTAFQAGVTVIKSAITQLSSFLSTSLIDAFVGSTDSFGQRLGELAKSLAQTLLDALIQVEIQRLIGATTEQASADAASLVRTLSANALADASKLELSNAIAAASARTGSTIVSSAAAAPSEGGFVPKFFAQGGRVLPDFAHFSTKAEGFARGTVNRPRHIPQSDTIPAWLTPGEFVVRAPVVRSVGVDFMRSLNEGTFKVPQPFVASAAHAEAGGMAKGGLVSDALRKPQAAAAQRGSAQQDFAILPVQVAREKDFDRQVHGGRNAMLTFLRENGFRPGKGK